MMRFRTGVASRQVPRIVVESPTLRNGQPMPREHTADGRNTSPGLAWKNVPEGTKELAVVMIDEDYRPAVPTGKPMLHWVVYRIPPTAQGLAAGMPTMQVITAPPELQGAFQAHSTFDVYGYRGPQPAPGEIHHYRFIVYALGAEPDEFVEGLPASEVFDLIRDFAIGEGELTVTYERAIPR